jgi:hypothetical protein
MNRNQDLAVFERDWGISLHGAVEFLKPEWKKNLNLAMDAQPTLITTGSSGIPQFLTAFIDPELLRVLTAKNRAVEILGEVKKGAFIDVTVMFPVIEQTGEVSSYGDFANNGRAGININFPTREAYLYQNIIEYGDLEMERAGLAKIGYAAELKQASVSILNKFQNLTYFYGVAGLQNYGLLNDPSLPGYIAPAPKAAGGISWWNGTVINATANEIYADLQGLFVQLVSQSAGNIEEDSKLVLCLSPKSAAALTTTNSFNVNVQDLIKKNFPNLRIETAIQYGALTAQNPQGSAAGEIVQLIAEEVEGQKTGYCAFNEKLRGGPVIRDLSAFKQKFAQGTWGAIIRQPFAFAQMIGI